MATVGVFSWGVDAISVNKVSKKYRPYYVTQEDESIPLRRFDVDKITRHQSVLG